MKNVGRLEEFWHNFVRIFPDTVEVQGAIVAYFLQIPVTLFNHVANVNITARAIITRRRAEKCASIYLLFPVVRNHTFTIRNTNWMVVGRASMAKRGAVKGIIRPRARVP